MRFFLLVLIDDSQEARQILSLFRMYFFSWLRWVKLEVQHNAYFEIVNLNLEQI